MDVVQYLVALVVEGLLVAAAFVEPNCAQRGPQILALLAVPGGTEGGHRLFLVHIVLAAPARLLVLVGEGRNVPIAVQFGLAAPARRGLFLLGQPVDGGILPLVAAVGVLPCSAGVVQVLLGGRELVPTALGGSRDPLIPVGRGNLSGDSLASVGRRKLSFRCVHRRISVASPLASLRLLAVLVVVVLEDV